MKSLRYLNAVLTVLSVLLALELWTTWTGSRSMVSPAQAAGSVPVGAALDTGAQQAEMIALLKQLNQNVSDQTEFLKSGQLRVLASASSKDTTK